MVQAMSKTAVETQKFVKLNLGCGKDLMDGYINVDLFSEYDSVLKMDIRRLDLPDNYADEVFSSHSLEHLPAPETIPVLQEWFRVLKPGGRIKLNLPDMEWCVKTWLSLPESERWGYPHAAIFGMQQDAGQIHYTSFTHARIKNLLEQCGFVNVTTRPIETFDQQCIWAEGVKPANAQNATPALGESGVINRTVHFYKNQLAGVDYDHLLTEELKRQNEVLKAEHAKLVGAFKQLENERDLYKARWQNYCLCH